MFWNTINENSNLFSMTYGYAPSIVYMNRKFYNGLENEIYGYQLRFLIKENRIRGLEVRIDDEVDIIVICSKYTDDKIVVTEYSKKR